MDSNEGCQQFIPKFQHRKYTANQTQAPLKAYKQNPYPDHRKKSELSELLHVPFGAISAWFQKERRHDKLMDPQTVLRSE